MILTELVGLVASFASALVSKPLQISVQDNERECESTFHEDLNEREVHAWVDREYEREIRHELLQETYLYDAASYISVGSESRIKPSFWKSLQRCLRANACIIIVPIPLSLLAIVLIYLRFNTTDLCFEWKNHNKSIPVSIRKWQLVGTVTEGTTLYIWFPMTLALLFGWKEFKLNYILTLYICFAVRAITVIYYTFLFVFGVYVTKPYYRYPADVLFVAGIIFSSIIVARQFRRIDPSTTYSNFHIVFMISFSFVAGSVISMIYIYLIVPYFNELEGEIDKAILAAITPALALIPTAICKYLALRQSSEMIQPDRSFLIAYFLRIVTIGIYRIMQADFKSFSIFIGLSLLHGFSNVLSKTTERLLEKMWTYLIACLNRTCGCRRVELRSLNTPHHRRLNADIEIQNILFEYTTVILSQAYLVLYLLTGFDISPWHVIKESLIRMAIALGIDLFFNCISVFIQIHYYDVPMRRVWLKCWKRHVIANVIVLMPTVLYFTESFLSVFQHREDSSLHGYTIRNCTLPFESW